MPRPYTRNPCGIYGARNLVLRHARRLESLQAEEGPAQEPPKQEELFSIYGPAPKAGVYSVSVDQEITLLEGTTNKLHLPEPESQAEFEVLPPRFCLPDGAIHSFFPPEGHGAPAKTLPHVVLTDPHLAWDRIASEKPTPSCPDWQRNQVPWLALLVFTPEELTLPADQLNGEDSLFAATSLRGEINQTPTLSISMKIADIPKLKRTVSPITSEQSDDSATDVVFVPSALFSELFTSYDETGNRIPQQTRPDVSRYKYLAHVRDMNTAGMAEAGVEDNGVFGIVLSHRTGPLSNTQPQPVIVHLVSIEGVESMNQKWPIDESQTPHVAMASLHSWTFVTQPNGSFDMETTLTNLGKGVNMLRASDSVINSIPDTGLAQHWVKNRFLDGYTLTKHRTQTGEETAAIIRGPLTPTRIPYPRVQARSGQPGLAWLSGADLQILDPELGLMDLTYSAAWNLGKTLALADQKFTTALVRLRRTIYNESIDDAKAKILGQQGGSKTQAERVPGLTETMSRLNDLHKNTKGHGLEGSMPDRWQASPSEHPDLSYDSPLIQDLFDKSAARTGEKLMLSPSGTSTSRYNKHNTPASADWAIVLKWVLDKMFLYDVPAHYLLTDPSHLPPESLRFFHLDRNWTDALIDGALSLGNHVASAPGTDNVRRAIHGMIHSYLHPPTPGPPPPQVPTYGFLLRSAAVTHCPDLRVSAQLGGVDAAAPILRHDIIDAAGGVMLCLLDRLPGEQPGLQSITLAPPPHQQPFVAGAALDAHRVETRYKRVGAARKRDAGREEESWETHCWMRPEGQSPPTPPLLAGQGRDAGAVPHAKAVFKWGERAGEPETRTLLFPA